MCARETVGMTDKHSGTALPQDYIDSIFRVLGDAAKEVGHFNLLTVGNTGAGKSTLVNAIFGWDIAATGIGRPVTMGTKEYRHPHMPLSIFDTRGGEIGESSEALQQRLKNEILKRRHLEVPEQIHVAWYCIRWSDRRLEDGQVDLIKAIADTGVPVVMVLTQVPRKDGRCHPDAEAMAGTILRQDLPLSPEGVVVFTAAKDDAWAGETKHGLHELLECTFQVAPKGAAYALNASQKINLQRKRDASHEAAKVAAAAAAAAVFNPLPIPNATLIVPIQIGMIARITSVWGLDLAKSTLANVIAAATVMFGATYVGREAVGILLKLIPGIGTAAAGAMNAGVASSLTLAVGHAWTLVMEELSKEDPETIKAMPNSEIQALFKQSFKHP